MLKRTRIESGKTCENKRLGKKTRDKRGEDYTNGDECWNNNERIFFQIKTVVIGQLVYIYLYASRTVMTRTIHVLTKNKRGKEFFFANKCRANRI